MSRWRRPRAWSWATLAAAFLAVTVLGFWGFTQYQAGARQPVSTRLYLTAQLFVMESGSVTGSVPWQLEVARLAAPATAAYAVVWAVAVVMLARVDRWRLRRARRHVIVVGLRQCGIRLCRGLAGSGRRVVGVDDAASASTCAALRADGVVVLREDGRHPETLVAAGIHRAANLVVLGSDDAATVRTIAGAREVTAARNRTFPLQCVGTLSNPNLWTLLMTAEWRRREPQSMRVDLVDAGAVGAMALLRRYPPERLTDGPATRNGHAGSVLVTGSGELATCVLLALARIAVGPDAGAPVPVTITGFTVPELDDLRSRHPETVRGLRISVADHVGEAVAATPAPVCAYVCEARELHAVDRVFDLRRLLGRGSRIVVVRPFLTATITMLGSDDGADGAAVRTFALMDAVCRPDVLLRGTTELLAQALHRMYLAGRAADGRVDADDPALRPWEDLPESLRESSRSQARHIPVKLRSVGRAIGPLSLGGDGRLTAAEIETMSQLEHERWVAERWQAGWTPGPRDAANRTTPFLVPWMDLADDIREYDREFVRQIPQLLASIGLQVLPPAPGRDAPSGTADGPTGPDGTDLSHWSGPSRDASLE